MSHGGYVLYSFVAEMAEWTSRCRLCDIWVFGEATRLFVQRLVDRLVAVIHDRYQFVLSATSNTVIILLFGQFVSVAEKLLL